MTTIAYQFLVTSPKTHSIRFSFYQKLAQLKSVAFRSGIPSAELGDARTFRKHHDAASRSLTIIAEKPDGNEIKRKLFFLVFKISLKDKNGGKWAFKRPITKGYQSLLLNSAMSKSQCNRSVNISFIFFTKIIFCLMVFNFPGCSRGVFFLFGVISEMKIDWW